jgi:3D (Asp-Asp-Asp) domain-containing protein
VTALLLSATLMGSTGYCLRGTMADGTYTRAGSVAQNGYPLGTRLWITPSPTGQRRFVVRDRIGWGTQLDFWTPTCGQAIAWGRRVVHVHVGWPKLRARWHGRKTRRGASDVARRSVPPGSPRYRCGGWAH